MRIFLLLTLVALCTALDLSAGSTLPPVDSGTWALKDADSERKGAVVLEQRIRFSLRYAEYATRIRILGSAGKDAAEFSGFSEDCYDLNGRTLLPDGTILPFTRKDMTRKTILKTGSQEIEQTVVVAPGLTDNCIVELSWKQSKPYWQGDYSEFGGMERVNLSGSYPVKHLVLEIPERFPWGWKLLPGPKGEIHETKSGSHIVLDLQDLPALEHAPYSLGGTLPACRLLLFPGTPQLHYAATKGPDTYWQEFGRRQVKEYFEDGIDKGKAYRSLLASLAANLPAGPGPQAVELLKRLDQRIRNVDYPTHAEEVAQSRKEAEAHIDPKDLDGAAQRGATSAVGMLFLYREMLKDLGLRPQVALVVDRDRAIFDRSMLCWQQFTSILIGVPISDGSSVWFDPSQRFAAPGVISAHFQGTPGLVFDPDRWEPKPFLVPVQGAAVNVLQYQYALNLTEDEDQFVLQAAFAGLPEYQERRKYMALSEQEQDRLLAEKLGQSFPGISFSNARVEHAADPDNNLAWRVEGRIDREPGRRRTVDPFPANSWALWIPDHLDSTRKDMIVFTHAMIFQETCHFQIPKGYRLGPVEPYVQANELGKVQWVLERPEGPDHDACRVAVRVELDRPILPASSYEHFKTFLGWVREACGRTLLLERQ